MNLECCSTLKSDYVIIIPFLKYTPFDFRYNFSFGEKALYVRTKQMLPRVVDEHTRINLTGQTINCRNSLQLFAMVYLGCDCTKI